MQYVERRKVVDAYQVKEDDTFDDADAWVKQLRNQGLLLTATVRRVFTVKGWLTYGTGDWFVREEDGHRHLVTDKMFHKAYELLQGA